MPDPILPLLQQIADNTARDDSLWIAIVAGASGILGAVLSGIIAYLAARSSLLAQAKTERKKLKATVVSTERLRWLQDLRNKTADFYTQMDMQLTHLERPLQLPNANALQDLLDKYSEQAVSLSHSIFPMLNTTKEHQRELWHAINNTLGFMGNVISAKKSTAPMQINKQPYAALKTEAFTALEGIGVKAWHKVQKLK